MNSSKIESTEDQPERSAFHTIVWTRRLPLFVDGRGKCDSKMRHVALVMATYADGKTGARSYPSIPTLMDETGYSEDEIKGALERIARVRVAEVVGQVRGIDCWQFNLGADFSEADTVESRATARRERGKERQQRSRDKRRHRESSVTSQGIERDSHRISSVTSQGIERDVTLNSPGTYPVPAQGDLPVGDLPSISPSLAAAPPKERGRTSTKSTKGDRAAVLAEKDRNRESRTQSLAELNPDWNPEPSWTLFLAEFEARARREGKSWTIQDWVATDIKATIASTLLAHESRDKVDRALVKCAREAKAPYSEKAVKAFLGEEHKGSNMTVEEREQEFGPGCWMDKALDISTTDVEADIRSTDVDQASREQIPVPNANEPELTVVIPEQRQATMDTTPPVEEDVEPEVDEVDGDPMPVGYGQYDTEDEEGIEEPVRVAPVKSRPIVVDIEALPWGTEQEIVQAVWPEGVPNLWVGDLVDTAARWLEDYLNLYRQEFPEEENTASAMNVMVPDVAEKVGHLARNQVVKAERPDPIQALRARLREKAAA